MLFDPIQIGSLTLCNRLVFLPTGTNLGDKEGFVTDKMIRHYVRGASGGVGMITVEAAGVDRGGRGNQAHIMIDRDDCIVGLSRLVREVKSAGDVKIAIQVHHIGRQGHSRVIGQQPVAPSAIPLFGEVPRELSVGEIKVLVEKFAQAVRRVKEAGFDAAEIHGAHGYLICGFLSPWSNKRTDEYGGDTERRARFALEIIQRSRELVGEDYPLFMRVSASEYVEGGIDLEEMKRLAPMFERAGICLLSISAGNYLSLHMTIPPMKMPKGCFVPLAEGVKQVVNIPVLVGGRINDPRLAEQLLQEGKADLIGMGRPLIADPDLPNKAKAGKFDSIRKCVACNSCADMIFSAREIRCMMNPEVGSETVFEILHTDCPKKVWVVGAGPGGLEAARVLAYRGHHVTLYEKGNRIGGQVNLAALPPWKQELNEIISYYTNALRELNVEIILNKEVTLEMVEENHPDAVLVATGSVPVVPDIPGVNSPHVVFAEEVLNNQGGVGKNVVVIGGALVGCETAHFLADKGKRVTILRRGEKIGKEVGYTTRFLLLESLKEHGVQMLPGIQYEKIIDDGIIIRVDGQSQFIKADNIVLAAGYLPNDTLFKALKGKVKEVHALGDCVEPRTILDAVHEASAIARSL